MPSPFPGMDPWLESPAVFPDLHDCLITYLREALNAQMPAGYYASGTVLTWADDRQRTQPDVSLLAKPPSPGNAAVLDAPARLRPLGSKPAPLPREEPYLEIRTATGERVVTAVEILSRADKAAGSNGRRAYRDKQQEFSLAGVNLVEVDLLRFGVHTTAAPLPRLEELAGGAVHYHVCVTEVGDRERLYGAAFPLDRPLPAIEVPLDPGVPRLTVTLQPLLDRVYDTGLYARRVNYDRPADPPLSPEDQAWAAGVLAAKGGG